MRTGLRVGQGVVVIGEVIAAGRSYGLQLVVGQAMAEMTAGCCQRIEKHIIRVVHLIHPEHLFQAAFIETAVMRYKRKALNHRGDLLPYVWEYRGAFRILLGEAVDLLTEPLIVLRLGVNQAVVRIHYLAITDDDHSNAADAGTTLIGGLEVYGGKRFQIREFLDMQR